MAVRRVGITMMQISTSSNLHVAMQSRTLVMLREAVAKVLITTKLNAKLPFDERITKFLFKKLGNLRGKHLHGSWTRESFWRTRCKFSLFPAQQKFPQSDNQNCRMHSHLCKRYKDNNVSDSN
ncbi:unnamed protein product [Dovyalis caffra]|uniref:Uncharacterized protein n=1 Tax=Dovyalis caffra TaxID=77055 RepID=A0AAV1SV66_9ROSI|nr:unnamed protein product [Dovyalis caffra]